MNSKRDLNIWMQFEAKRDLESEAYFSYGEDNKLRYNEKMRQIFKS